MQSEPIDADAALTLLRDRIAALEGCEEASDWTTSSTATLVALVRDQHTVAEAEDVCLLRSVKDAFKSAGISDLSAREEAMKAYEPHHNKALFCRLCRIDFVYPVREPGVHSHLRQISDPA